MRSPLTTERANDKGGRLARGGQAAGSGGARRGVELDKELRFLAKQEKDSGTANN